MDDKKGMFPGKDGRRRIKRIKAIISNPCGNNLELQQEKILIQHPSSGSIESIETSNSLILPDTLEKITSPAAIKGICHICGAYVTAFSLRFCRYCGQLCCARDARYIEEKQHYACRQCAKKLKIKKIFSGAFRLLTSPFIEKKEQV